MDVEITLQVNGATQRLVVATRTTLLDALRERAIAPPPSGAHGSCGSSQPRAARPQSPHSGVAVSPGQVAAWSATSTPPGLYTIRIQGRLTVLTGPLTDQSAVFGVLAQIEALGLELLELRQIRA